MQIGIDIGSTTIKYVVLGENSVILDKSYERHFSQITEKASLLIQKIIAKFNISEPVMLSITGSAGMGMALDCKIPFIQEVYATRLAANTFLPGTDVIIELGGEDAKILFLTSGTEVRMNGTCAGGTGAFIDQMATLMKLTPDEMNATAQNATQVYTIASRCGVFAKSDIQPLLNQGALKADISRSIFYAVVNQTISGLAQGRPIEGNVVYLGGPLTFMEELRRCFDKTLHLHGVCPDNSLYYAALGSALAGTATVDLQSVVKSLEQYKSHEKYNSISPLFCSETDYEAFSARHAKNVVLSVEPESYHGNVYLGIDSGSTTIKVVVISEDMRILCSLYTPNNGNPVTIVRNFLVDFYKKYPHLHISSSAVTGYGEDLIKNAILTDFGVVETVAHFTAALKFMPDVEFIIDIGGQDIKCFKIHNGAIDNIFLNEACSSGCGSFLQTFANALGISVEEFSKIGLLADKPVDLGSRCTVFMNSSVKQAQKDGASLANISAGLSISVVKNALYKVIRASSAKELGHKIVVQGGTFLNDAVLRAFEQELGADVIRPNVAGLMGAYGAALFSMRNRRGKSTILPLEKLEHFSHAVQATTCKGCSNNCKLTINTFDDSRKFISGNRCDRPITNREADDSLNIYSYKLDLLKSYKPISGKRGKIGIPMGLNMLEMLPYWHTFFTKLGFETVTSPQSTRALYLDGQASIPSDTVCFPAKLMHGHIQSLINSGISTIFYPCMTYNVDEKLGDNHFNCPVVAYYPEVIAGNLAHPEGVTLISDYIGMHKKSAFPQKMFELLKKYFPGINAREVRIALKYANQEYHSYMQKIRERGAEIIAQARQRNVQIVVLAGRPYHVDSEINHGIDKLVLSCGAAVVSEDCLSYHLKKQDANVLNQWTYHSRLYSASHYIAQNPDMNLVQLVSFGCGLDAITTDEVREIIEKSGKIYTQIKIDEIANLGAVKIRMRSLFAAIDALKGGE